MLLNMLSFDLKYSTVELEVRTKRKEHGNIKSIHPDECPSLWKSTPALANAKEVFFSTTDTDLDRQFRLAEVKLGNEGVAMRYGARYMEEENPAGYKIDVIIFVANIDCMENLHTYARQRFHDMNDDFRRRIPALTERYRKKYDSIVSDGDIVSKHNFRLPETISMERSTNGDAYSDHLFIGKDGTAVIALNNWEKIVLRAEQTRPDYVCWLRNPPRKPWALCIPYEQNGDMKSMYPDFLIVRKDEEGERIPLTICDYDREKGTVTIEDVGTKNYAIQLQREKLSLKKGTGKLPGSCGKGSEKQAAVRFGRRSFCMYIILPQKKICFKMNMLTYRVFAAESRHSQGRAGLRQAAWAERNRSFQTAVRPAF